MIKFLRRIRQNLLTENKFSKYMLYAIGEILLVVIGILIALQINNWNEGRKAKAQEVSSMKEIIENLKYDIVRCQKNIKTNTSRIKGLDSLRTSVSHTIDGKDETAYIYYYALKYGDDFSQAVLNRATYNEMTNSGSIKNINNKKLVQGLSDYYERIASTVPESQPNASHTKMLDMQKKIISYKQQEGYIETLNVINVTTFDRDYDFNQILTLEHLELLRPNDLYLSDYYNEISQFEIDLKTYLFYMSWTTKVAKRLIKDIEKEYQLMPTEI
tara:strand:- start:1687 stop:2502 length:816 start_codon:yes stop_codon:yes gene_type:complete